MLDKFFSLRALLGLALLLIFLVSGTVPGEAKRAGGHELNYLKVYETEVAGKEALRIEIGFDKDGLDYNVFTRPYLKKQVVIDLPNTRPDDVKETTKLKSELAKSVTIKEIESHHTQVAVDLTGPVVEGVYQVHEEKADRKRKLPHRIVIDIFAEPQGETVEGVSGRNIVIDPGHGGSDTGAIGPDGVTEKSVTLAVSKKLENILTASGAKVTMTREVDADVYGRGASDAQELQARVDVGERAHSEIFVSVHCNAFSSAYSHGMETYYCYGSRRGERLASLINEELESAGGLMNRGVKTANFYVLRHSSMPATLLELGFVTNPEEEALLADDEYQKKLAKAIALGIARYFTE